MKKYPKYKPSGIDWIGDIPEGWEVIRLKTIASLIYGHSLSCVDRGEGDVPVYGSNGQVGWHNRAITEAPCIVVGRKGSFGKVNYSYKPVFPIDTTYFIDNQHTTANLRWLFYILLLLDLNKFSNDTGVPGLSREYAHNKFLCIPKDNANQQEIADFLDKKTAKIDELIDKKKRMIALLKEERMAVINQAVTRGLNPDVPMKPSGIDWLGDIPAHWEVKKLKWCLSCIESGSRETGGGNQLDEGIFSIGGEHITWLGKLILEPPKFISEEYYNNLKKGKIQSGDLLLVKDGATIGKIVLVKNMPFNKTAVNEHVFILRTNALYNNQYLFYCIWCDLGQKQIYLQIRGSAQGGLTSEFINYVLLPEISLYEQQKIADFLDKKTAKIDALVAKIESAIEKLQEYRASLITSAVTGKIDVREETA